MIKLRKFFVEIAETRTQIDVTSKSRSNKLRISTTKYKTILMKIQTMRINNLVFSSMEKIEQQGRDPK